MADLRRSLRPFVDAASASGPRLQIDELAARARRRRARRRTRLAATAGLAATIAVVFTLTRPDSAPDDTEVSVVDSSHPTTTTTTAAPSATTTPGVTDPITADVPSATTASTAPRPPGTATVDTTSPGIGNDDRLTSPIAGLAANSTTTSSWDTGYCLQITVENTTASPADWQLDFAAGGTIADKWNVLATEHGDGTITFTGEPFNHTLPPTATTSFGTCIDT
jgi:cellulase/cellobiase CelA1